MVEQTSEAKEIFLQAVELGSPQAWPEFLDKACSGNPELRQHVERLLQAHNQSNSLLDGSGIAVTSASTTTQRLGTLIGPYKLLEQIGEGGMGIVYMAQQTQPVK